MSLAARPRRSVLYMPGANARALDKARGLDADTLILDLEDAVAPDAKALARQQVAAALRAGGYGRRECVVRDVYKRQFKDRLPISRNEKIEVKLLSPAERDIKREDDGVLVWNWEMEQMCIRDSCSTIRA